MNKLIDIITRKIIDGLINRGLIEQISDAVADVIRIKVFEITRIEIAKLELKPGDTIVLKCKTSLSDQAVAHLKASFDDLWPDRKHKVVVLEEDLDIAVLSE